MSGEDAQATPGFTRTVQVELGEFPMPVRSWERPSGSSAMGMLSLGLCERFDVMELAVIEMQSTVLGFFQDVVEGGVPNDVLTGILRSGHQHLTRRFICAAHAEDERCGDFG